MITVYYHSIDGVHKSFTYNNLAEAQEKAQYWVGRYPTIGHFGKYAISDDGIGKITCRGCDIQELFPGAE